MPSVPLVLPTRASARPRRPDGLLRIAASWRAVRDRYLQRRNAAEIHGLDERTLRDLGVARAEIDALVAARARRVASAP